MSRIKCKMSNAYIDPWDMLNNFCFHVYAQTVYRWKWQCFLGCECTCQCHWAGSQLKIKIEFGVEFLLQTANANDISPDVFLFVSSGFQVVEKPWNIMYKQMVSLLNVFSYFFWDLQLEKKLLDIVYKYIVSLLNVFSYAYSDLQIV